jgi:DNA processing protein
MVTVEQRRLLTLCAIRVDGQSVDWSLLAREATRHGGLDRLYRGELVERSSIATDSLPVLREGLEQLGPAQERAAAEAEMAEAADARVVTVLDPAYPANLRLVPDLPPFLFLRGQALTPADVRSVAVVGTRDASSEGLSKASLMATRLVQHEVTVISGLARGIDTAAHKAALSAGGRTIAVMGTGISSRVYPPENEELANDIAATGALISQFWPSARPARWTFPRRNAVMSGVAQGTVVIEAGSTSGAKMQARLALEQGKRVFLVSSLVTNQEWARKYLQRGAVEVAVVEDVIRLLAAPERVLQATEQRQLTLDMV